MTISWTIKTLLSWATDYFAKQNISTPRLDSELLLAHVLGLKKLDLYLQFDRPLQPDELTTFKSLIKRRADQEPVAYLTGKKEFWSRDFFVSKDVLIPRPETEFIVQMVLDHFPKDVFRETLTGFEVGLGSGCIAVTLLCEFVKLVMSAVEISEKAVVVARKNAEQYGVMERLEIIHENFLRYSIASDQRPATGDLYDFIISNPPYISLSEKDKLPQSVRDFEPYEALFAENEGLQFYPKIAEFAKNSLRENGIVAVEIGEKQGQLVKEIFEKAGFERVEIKKDYARLDRVVVAYS